MSVHPDSDADTDVQPVPGPRSVAELRALPRPKAAPFKNMRVPGVTLLAGGPADLTVRLDTTDEGLPEVRLSPTQARSLASALFAFAELIEPKREPRGSGWRPA